MSKYVSEFLSLKCAPDVLASVGFLGNKPEKEITEAFAILKKIKKITMREPDKYEVVDLCSGNALVPILSAFLYKVKYAFAFDKLRRERNWNLVNNFMYKVFDIYKIPNDWFSHPTILTAVHSCRDLAEQTIKIYNESENIQHLILMPCCIGNLDTSLLRFIKEQANGDLAWVTKLAMQCKGKVSISKDNFVLSPKNYIIWAQKEDTTCDVEDLKEGTWKRYNKLVAEGKIKPQSFATTDSEKTHNQVGTTAGNMPVYDNGDYTYIRFSEVPKEFEKDFNAWIWGQTIGIMYGESVVYSWDWERFYYLKTKNIPTYFD